MPRQDYEERQERRRERLEARAEKQHAEAKGRWAESDRMAGMMQGQPILVGHHSEKRHRRDIDRMWNHSRKGCEAHRNAEDLERRAESVGKAGVSSDDPEAVTKLKTKLESLKAAEEVAGADLQRWRLEKQRVELLEQTKRANAKEVYDTLADFLMAQNKVREAKQDVAQQQTLVELKQTEIAKTKILAPFDGYVTELRSEVGQWMPRGGQVVEMIDIETVLVRVDAPESAISHIRVGDEARIVLDALECAFEGRVKYVIPRAHEQARTFPVDIEIANPEHKLHSGLFARCTVKTGPAGKAVSVPKDAVVQQKGTSRIWMVQEAGPQGAMAIPVHVTLGAEVSDVDGQWVAVTSGNVLPGMKVVVRGNEQLMPFPSPVVVVQEEALISTGMAPATSDQRGDEHVDHAGAKTEERSGTR